jgi:hypothetical protein
VHKCSLRSVGMPHKRPDSVLTLQNVSENIADLDTAAVAVVCCDILQLKRTLKELGQQFDVLILFLLLPK